MTQDRLYLCKATVHYARQTTLVYVSQLYVMYCVSYARQIVLVGVSSLCMLCRTDCTCGCKLTAYMTYNRLHLWVQNRQDMWVWAEDGCHTAMQSHLTQGAWRHPLSWHPVAGDAFGLTGNSSVGRLSQNLTATGRRHSGDLLCSPKGEPPSHHHPLESPLIPQPALSTWCCFLYFPPKLISDWGLLVSRAWAVLGTMICGWERESAETGPSKVHLKGASCLKVSGLWMKERQKPWQRIRMNNTLKCSVNGKIVSGSAGKNWKYVHKIHYKASLWKKQSWLWGGGGGGGGDRNRDRSREGETERCK